MLVLSRRPGESILIGSVEVKVIKIKGTGAVSLAIHAPDDVKILRRELTNQPRRNENAIDISSDPWTSSI